MVSWSRGIVPFFCSTSFWKRRGFRRSCATVRQASSRLSEWRREGYWWSSQGRPFQVRNGRIELFADQLLCELLVISRPTAVCTSYCSADFGTRSWAYWYTNCLYFTSYLYNCAVIRSMDVLVYGTLSAIGRESIGYWCNSQGRAFRVRAGRIVSTIGLLMHHQKPTALLRGYYCLL